MRARRVLEHPPPAENLEPVCERPPLPSLAEVHGDRRVDVRARTLDVACQVGERDLPAAPLERSQREQQQQATAIISAGHSSTARRRPLTDVGRTRIGRRSPSGVGGPDARAAVLPTSNW